MTNNTFRIRERSIGQSEPPYVIAEAGVHHYNSVELAKAYIREAAIAGADAIKFQTYEANKLATVWAPTYWSEESTDKQQEFFSRRSQLDENEYAELITYADQVGITFLSTPFDEESVEMLAELGVPAFKIASADITHYPLIRKVVEQGKAVLLSTGASYMAEVKKAVKIIEEAEVPLVLLHCNLAYPTPVRQANLLRIGRLQQDFPKHVVGYSDHTRPQDSLLPCSHAVILGARVVEKHFTLNKKLEGDDHDHAVDAQGLQTLVRDCSDAFRMIQDFQEVTESERPARERARRSIVAGNRISEGQTITLDDLEFKRPGTGIPPSRVKEVLGRSVIKSLERDDLITPDVLD